MTLKGFLHKKTNHIYVVRSSEEQGEKKMTREDPATNHMFFLLFESKKMAKNLESLEMLYKQLKECDGLVLHRNREP